MCSQQLLSFTFRSIVHMMHWSDLQRQESLFQLLGCKPSFFVWSRIPQPVNRHDVYKAFSIKQLPNNHKPHNQPSNLMTGEDRDNTHTVGVAMATNVPVDMSLRVPRSTARNISCKVLHTFFLTHTHTHTHTHTREVTCRSCLSGSWSCLAATMSGSWETLPAVWAAPHFWIFLASTTLEERTSVAPCPRTSAWRASPDPGLDLWTPSASGWGCLGTLLCTGTSFCLLLLHFILSFSLSGILWFCPTNMYVIQVGRFAHAALHGAEDLCEWVKKSQRKVKFSSRWSSRKRKRRRGNVGKIQLGIS